MKIAARLITPIVLLLAAPFAHALTARHILIRGVTVIDGSGRAAYGPVDVEISDGRIKRINEENEKTRIAWKLPADHQIIDGTGKFLTPGLIDAHTHLPSVPGAMARMDDAKEIRAQQLRQMKIYLAAGVTTVLDAVTPAPFFKTLEEFKKEATIPRVLTLAPFITPAGGYMASHESRGYIFKDLWAPVATAKDVRDRFSKAAPLKALGAKVTDEYGFGPFKVWPALSDELRAEIVAQSKNFGAPLFVHSEREEEFENALKLKPYAFMHGGFFDQELSDEMTAKIKASEAYVVSTLAVFKLMGLLWNREMFEDAWFKMLVPQNQRDTALDASATEKVIEAMAVQNKPKWCPESIARTFASLFVNRRSIGKSLASSMNAVAKMYHAQIPIVSGADEGNWPLQTTAFHGVGEIFEIELLQDAGLPTLEAIRASTSRAAEMLKLADVGIIAEGNVADLLLLSVDPQTNRDAFRKIDFVVKSGVAKAPADWLK